MKVETIEVLTTFREAFCKKFAVPQDAFVEAVFKRSLRRRARLIYKLLEVLKPGYFEEDLWTIQELAMISDPGCFESEVNRLYGRNQRSKSFLRRRLKMRVSGKRLLNLKTLVYRQGQGC